MLLFCLVVFVITQNDRFTCTIFVLGLFIQFLFFLLMSVILVISSLLIKLFFPLFPSFYSLLLPSFLSFSLLLSFLSSFLFFALYFKDSQICTRIICIHVLVNVDMTPDLTLSALVAQISIVHMEC